MTINIYACKRMRAYEEPNGSFGTDNSGSMGSFLEVPFCEGTVTLKLNQGTESPMHSQQHMDGYPLEVLMLKSAQLDFTVNLETFTTKGTPAQGALGLLLKVAMGAETLGTSSTITSGATATSLPLTSAAGVGVGTAIGWSNGSGTLEMREVASKSGNTLTLKLGLSGSPSNGATIYSSATYSMGGTDGSLTTSLQIAFEGLYTNDRFLLTGGYLNSIALELAPGALPKVKFSWSFANWYYASAMAGNFAGTGTLATSTYLNNVSLVQKDSYLMQQTVGTSTYSASTTLLHAPVIEFTPNIKYTLHRTPGGVNTIKQSLRDRSAPVITGAFVIPHEGTTWTTARDSQTVIALAYQIGSVVATGGSLITAPTTQITDVQQMNQDGITCQRVEWKGRLDTGTSGSTANLAVSAFRIHLM